MRIHLPLLSILASAYLLGMVLLGASVSLYDVSMTVASGPDGLTAELHPTFLCWMDAPLQFHGTCFGNVMVCSSSMWSQTHTRCLVAHEARHLEHWRALGLWTWLAQYVLPLEPEATDWSDPSAQLAQMWRPPQGWVDRWAFVALSLNLRTSLRPYTDTLAPRASPGGKGPRMNEVGSSA